VSIDTLRNAYPAIPGYLFSPSYGKLQVVDFKTNPPSAVSSFAPYAVMFPRLNADGNGVDGVVLPEIAVPVATYSGRNTRAAGFAKGELCHTLGSYMPFARTATERKANGDPRLSIEERYRDESDYRTRLMAQARKLVAERLMLEADAESYASAVLPDYCGSCQNYAQRRSQVRNSGCSDWKPGYGDIVRLGLQSATRHPLGFEA
jgi:hypothetical protein